MKNSSFVEAKITIITAIFTFCWRTSPTELNKVKVSSNMGRVFNLISAGRIPEKIGDRLTHSATNRGEVLKGLIKVIILNAWMTSNSQIRYLLID